MTSEKALPGRSGNITAEQEVKLKEMWSHLLVYAGTAPKDLTTSITHTSTSSAPKKKGGMFGFGKDKHVDDAATQAELFRASVAKMNPENFLRVYRYMSRADNPDNLLLRFLRARKWDVAKALEMLGTTLSWRLEAKVEEILAGGEEKAIEDKDTGLILQYKTGKANLHGQDMKGRPIVEVHVKLHDPKAQSEESIERFTILLIEAARLCLNDPQDTAAVIFDLTDFTLGNMDYAAVKFIIQCFERHYPESLGFLLIHRAPWVFQGVWNVIKGWIDPVVASKISFTRNYKDVTKFIAPEQIPKLIDGKREYEYKYVPPIDGENDKMKDTATKEKLLAERTSLFTELEDLTVEWIKATGPESDAINVKREDVIKKIADNYWSLDPYVRARSIYDRDGTLAEFKPQLKQPELESAFHEEASGKAEDSKVEATATAVPAAVTA